MSQRHKQTLTQVLDETEFSFFRCRFCLEDVYIAQNSINVAMICFDVLRNNSLITLNYHLKIIKYYNNNIIKFIQLIKAWTGGECTGGN